MSITPNCQQNRIICIHFQCASSRDKIYHPCDTSFLESYQIWQLTWYRSAEYWSLWDNSTCGNTYFKVYYKLWSILNYSKHCYIWWSFTNTGWCLCHDYHRPSIGNSHVMTCDIIDTVFFVAVYSRFVRCPLYILYMITNSCCALKFDPV